MGHFLLPPHESVWMLRVWSLEDHQNGYSIMVLGFVNRLKQTLYRHKNYGDFPLKGKLVGGWAGQSSIEDLSQNLVPQSNWMLFSLFQLTSYQLWLFICRSRVYSCKESAFEISFFSFLLKEDLCSCFSGQSWRRGQSLFYRGGSTMSSSSFQIKLKVTRGLNTDYMLRK